MNQTLFFLHNNTYSIFMSKGINPIEAVRFVEFINFSPEIMSQIAEDWKNIPNIESVAVEDSIVVFKFSTYKPKPEFKEDDKVLAKCRKENEGLATLTMKRLKNAINKACPAYYFNLNKMSITNKRK